MNNEQPAANKLDIIHKTYEKAARHYCLGIGQNPDSIVVIPMKSRVIGGNAAVRVERWKLVAEELYDLSSRLVAIREGSSKAPEIVQ